MLKWSIIVFGFVILVSCKHVVHVYSKGDAAGLLKYNTGNTKFYIYNEHNNLMCKGQLKDTVRIGKWFWYSNDGRVAQYICYSQKGEEIRRVHYLLSWK